MKKFTKGMLIAAGIFAAAGIGQAIMNRLLKAAGHQVLEV